MTFEELTAGPAALYPIENETLHLNLQLFTLKIGNLKHLEINDTKKYRIFLSIFCVFGVSSIFSAIFKAYFLHILSMDVQKAVTLDLDLISCLQIYALNVFEPKFIFSRAFLHFLQPQMALLLLVRSFLLFL